MQLVILKWEREETRKVVKRQYRSTANSHFQGELVFRIFLKFHARKMSSERETTVLPQCESRMNEEWERKKWKRHLSIAMKTILIQTVPISRICSEKSLDEAVNARAGSRRAQPLSVPLSFSPSGYQNTQTEKILKNGQNSMLQARKRSFLRPDFRYRTLLNFCTDWKFVWAPVNPNSVHPTIFFFRSTHTRS